MNAAGCPDEDGDGFPDWINDSYRAYRAGTELDVCPGVFGSAFRGGGAGCPDSDNDGWPDPVSNNNNIGVDICPDERGYARTETGRGCPDRDGDGWADFEDDFPNDRSSRLDSDGDGVADEEDDFPNNALLSDGDQVGGLYFSGCGLVFMVVVFLVTRNKLPPKPKTFDVGRF